MTHILLDIKRYIDLWISTQLVPNIYLKSMEGVLFLIDCEKLSAIFFFCINKFPQVAMLVGAMDVSP
jgi:hypothetical protein